MSLGRAVSQGMMAMFLQHGVKIDKFDEINQTMHITVPEDSFAYHRPDSKVIHDVESYVKRNKQVLQDLLKMPNLKVFYRTYPGYWTKEQGDQNFNEHINDYLDTEYLYGKYF